MRGSGEPQEVMLAVVNLEERVPKDHPLRTIKTVADEALARLSPEFDRMYSKARRTHSAIDGRTTRHASYRASQKVRKPVGEVFGWMKTVGGFRRTRYRSVERTGLAGYFVATAYNLVRMANLVSYQGPRAAQSV